MSKNTANTPTGISGNNTTVDESDDLFKVTLHSTCIVELMSNGNVWLDTGGWATVTTASRMNQALRYLNSRFGGRYPFRISRKLGVMQVWNRDTDVTVPFSRSCILMDDGKVEVMS